MPIIALLLLTVPQLVTGVRAADFDLRVSPTYVRIRAGETAHFSVSLLTMTPGFSNDVYLRALFEPPAVSVTFSDNPLNPTGDVDSEMVVRTSVHTAPGLYTITVRGRDPVTDQNVYADVTLEVLPPHEPEFRLSIFPSSLKVERGERAFFTVHATPLYRFDGPIYLSLICPSCLSHSFDPNPMCPSSGPCGCPALSCNTYTSTLTVDTSNMEPGNYSLVIQGCHDGLCDRAYATLSVVSSARRVNLIVYPVTVRVRPGESFHLRMTIGVEGGQSPEPLTLRVAAPPGWYISRQTVRVLRTSHLDLWVTVPESAGPGTYGMGVELYRGGDLLKSRQVMILVRSVRGELSVDVRPGHIVLSGNNPRAELVILLNSSESGVREAILTLVGLPSGISYAMPARLAAGGMGTLNLTLEGAEPGRYNATLIAKADCCVDTADFEVVVEGPETRPYGQGIASRTVTRTVTLTKTVTLTGGPPAVRTVTVNTGGRAKPLIDSLTLGLVGVLAVLGVLLLLFIVLRRSSTAGEVPQPGAG